MRCCPKGRALSGGKGVAAALWVVSVALGGYMAVGRALWPRGGGVDTPGGSIWPWGWSISGPGGCVALERV